MALKENRFGARATERIFLLIISVVMGLLFYNLYTVLAKDFDEVPRRLRQGTMMNLNQDKPGERIKTLLQKGFYYRDSRDIELISSVVSRAQNVKLEVVDNIGELNKKKY